MFYILWHRLEEMLCKRENHFLESEKAREQETEGGILRGWDAPEPATPFPVHRSDIFPSVTDFLLFSTPLIFFHLQKPLPPPTVVFRQIYCP